MIRVHNLTKNYGSLKAVQNISFELEKGEVLGFLGPNGAGKTTTMRIITGYMPPTKGAVHIEGVDIFDHPLEAKKKIGYLPENPPLYNDMNVADYLDFVADIKRVPSKDKKKRLMYVMDRCGITGVSKRIIAHLSKGYKQRVGIAQALINNPSVLVLDEPTNGLDPVQIIEIRELIKSLSGERTVILSTHILPEVTMICSRVIIINEGRIALEEPLDSLSLNLRGTHNLFLKVRQDSEEVKEKIESIENIARVNSGAPGEYVISLANGADVRDELTKTAVAEGWGLLELRPLTHTLEEVFLKVISSEG